MGFVCRGVKRCLTALYNPVLVKTPLGMLTGIDVLVMSLIITLLVWTFYARISNDFQKLVPAKHLKLNLWVFFMIMCYATTKNQRNLTSENVLCSDGSLSCWRFRQGLVCWLKHALVFSCFLSWEDYQFLGCWVCNLKLL